MQVCSVPRMPHFMTFPDCRYCHQCKKANIIHKQTEKSQFKWTLRCIRDMQGSHSFRQWNLYATQGGEIDPTAQHNFNPQFHFFSTKVIKDNKLLNIAQEDTSCQVALFVMKLVMNNVAFSIVLLTPHEWPMMLATTEPGNIKLINNWSGIPKLRCSVLDGE